MAARLALLLFCTILATPAAQSGPGSEDAILLQIAREDPTSTVAPPFPDGVEHLKPDQINQVEELSYIRVKKDYVCGNTATAELVYQHDSPLVVESVSECAGLAEGGIHEADAPRNGYRTFSMGTDVSNKGHCKIWKLFPEDVHSTDDYQSLFDHWVNTPVQRRLCPHPDNWRHAPGWDYYAIGFARTDNPNGPEDLFRKEPAKPPGANNAKDAADLVRMKPDAKSPSVNEAYDKVTGYDDVDDVNEPKRGAAKPRRKAKAAQDKMAKAANTKPKAKKAAPAASPTQAAQRGKAAAKGKKAAPKVANTRKAK